MYATCGTSSYKTSEIYFPENAKIGFNLRFVYFTDPCFEEPLPDYNKILDNLNNFYSRGNIEFRIHSTLTIVNSEIKEDMPSFKHYHFKHFKNDSTITCYIYGNDQPHYSEDEKFTAGVAGGIGSNFFAIRRAFMYEITVEHEMFHCFSLYHATEPSKGTGYSVYDSDLVCDTRYVEDLSEKIDENCNFIGDDDLTEEEKKQAVCNIMSWNYLKCRCCSTEGQFRRARFYIHESPLMHEAMFKGLNTDVQ